MASSQDIHCGICDRQEITKHASKWCPECDEGLCSECEKIHIVIKSCQHHKVISIKNYKTLPSNVSNIEHYCQEHKREFKNYCPQHDKLCCPRCISIDHNNCSGFMALEDIAKDAKTSTLLNDIEQSLRDTNVNIEQVIKDREQNLAKIKEQRKKIQFRIKETRNEIKTHLDELEKKALQELDTAEKSVQSKMDNLLVQLKEKRKSVEDVKKMLIDVKSYASDLQAFFATKHLENRADQEVKSIMSMTEDEILQQIDLKCEINEKILDVLTIPSFASVTMEKGKTTVVLCTEKDKAAQMLSVIPKPPRDINAICLKLLQKFDIPKGQKLNSVTGCAFFPNGNIAIADCDHNKRIVITNVRGELQKDIPVSPSSPYDVTCLHDCVVVFSSDSDSKVCILNTASKAITKTFTTTNPCYGITNRQGTIIYCERGKGIQQQQLDTESVHTVVKESIPHMNHVTTNETNIYHTNYKSNTVTCYNLSGEKVWEFKNTSILSEPFGVAVDKQSNIFLASNRNKSIVVLSSDGKNSRQLLKGSEVENPRGLAIDKQREKLIVTGYGGRILLYEIYYT